MPVAPGIVKTFKKKEQCRNHKTSTQTKVLVENLSFILLKMFIIPCSLYFQNDFISNKILILYPIVVCVCTRTCIYYFLLLSNFLCSIFYQKSINMPTVAYFLLLQLWCSRSEHYMYILTLLRYSAVWSSSLYSIYFGETIWVWSHIIFFIWSIDKSGMSHSEE